MKTKPNSITSLSLVLSLVLLLSLLQTNNLSFCQATTTNDVHQAKNRTREAPKTNTTNEIALKDKKSGYTGGGSFRWGWGSGGGGGGGSGGGGGGGGGRKGRRSWGRGEFARGEYAQCMGRGKCKGMRLDCPLHCGGPCFYDCLYMCKAHCQR